ncbi:MAG: hypothetical protein UT61_C0012G0020 [Candidatus Woesebacteria bacterium GW2011_GWA1_39_8]|uniref:Uncharacterized protein n=1 Tax=Candidatus Woesebacteria bacterium GW2011_GWA1_39_8 TaxID=1618552 RepID=A0A0G0S608_9BACT|nr:MAG: hypothetical protein UT61_C0012G0020 [Candidatus Woesebacteria bacterium GW2011_GWA1_39_8]
MQALKLLSKHGLNKSPAIEESSVVITEKNSIDALKPVADIVLLSDLITDFINATIESHKIFRRVYALFYSSNI